MTDKISPNYRNDSSGGIAPELRDYLDQEYFRKLDHIGEFNPKLLVVFAGGNGIGKSRLSSRIANELRGVRIENDGVKRVLLEARSELAMTDELHRMTWQYTMDLYRRLDSLTNNGLIIRDGVITWYYDRILPIFTDRGYELFIIGYNLSESKMRELIVSRGDTATTTAKRQIELIPDQKFHLNRFLGEYNANITLDDESIFDHDRVVNLLKERLKVGASE